MSIFPRKRRSNLLKKFIAPAVISSSLFSYTSAIKQEWTIENFKFTMEDDVNDKNKVIVSISGDGMLPCEDCCKTKNLRRDFRCIKCDNIAKSINERNKKNKNLEIRILDSITCVSSHIFRYANCAKLVKVTFSDSLKVVSSGLFAHCHELKEVIFPEKIEKMRGRVFMCCKNLEKVVLPKEIDEVSFYYLFYYCEKIEIIKLPEKIRNVSDHLSYNLVGTFEGCKSLNEIEIEIGEELYLDKTFKGCQSATRISVENVCKAENIIDDCTNLITLNLKTSNSKIKSIKHNNTPNLIEINIQQI